VPVEEKRAVVIMRDGANGYLFIGGDKGGTRMRSGSAPFQTAFRHFDGDVPITHLLKQ
jgi:hypothetical protein